MARVVLLGAMRFPAADGQRDTLAMVIFAAGIFAIITYFRLQREHPSGWMLLNGIAGLLLGGLIWVQWPSTSAWAVGTLMGVNLLMTGITRLRFGVAGPRLIKHATASTRPLNTAWPELRSFLGLTFVADAGAAHLLTVPVAGE